MILFKKIKYLKMESLGKDVLTLIAIEMAYPDILKFCSSSSKINKAVCKNEDFWRNKLYKTYPRLKHWQFSNYRKAYSDTEKIMNEINSQIADDKSKKYIPRYIKEELINFLSYANFGTFPESEIPLNFFFFPLLDLGIMGHFFTMKLFQIYNKVNNLRFFENGKIYYKVGSDMEKYLGKYLNTYDAQRNLKPGFNRNKFTFEQQSRIYFQLYIPMFSLTDSQKEFLSSSELLMSKIDKAFKFFKLYKMIV